MYIKRTFISILGIIVTGTMCCMEHHTKEVIEQEEKDYLAQYGTQDAPKKIQKLNRKILSLYKEKGFLNKNTAILVKHINTETIESLKNEGCSTWNNALTNGRNLIHISPQHDQLTSEEIRSRLAHEQAHVVLEQNAYLNPHYYMDRVHLWAFTFGIPVAVFITPFAVASSKRFGRTLARSSLTLAGLIGGNIYLNKQLNERWDLPSKSPNRLQYLFLRKYEEAECDIIAAFTIPNGARAGESLYKKSLEHNGDRNGIDGDHPYTSTRVWYHTKIRQLQNLLDAKEKPDIKEGRN